MQRYEFGSLGQLSAALCAAVVANLEQAIAERGIAVLVLSGGRTPKTYLPELFSAPLAWDKVHITLSDERWVAPNHPDSNEGLVRRLMPADVANAITFTGLWAEAVSPEEATDQVTARLAALPQPFDAAILGMGEDGHFASLFPGTGAVLSTAPHCLAVTDAPSYPRMSLSPQALTSVRNLYLGVTGDAKLKLLDQAETPGDADALPVRLLVEPPAGDKLTVYAAP